MNLNLCTLRISAMLLKHLQLKRIVSYPDLFKVLPEEAEEGSKEIVFRSSINLLFLLGKIGYLAKSDSFEFIEDLKEQSV